MGILIVDVLRISAQLWMFSMHAAAMLFMCCSQNAIIDAHQGSWGWLLHLINQGQLAVEIFFILSGMLFYKSAAASNLMQPNHASMCAKFVITRCLRLWPIMFFSSCFLLLSPMVPNRAAAAWTLFFASNRLPWNKQFLSWLWSISVDVQYFVVAVIAVFACSYVPSRAATLLTALAICAVATSVILSIQTASELINAPAGSELRVPMPVIGIDWMQEAAMSAAVDSFYSSMYLSAVHRCLPWVMGLAVAHLTRGSSHTGAIHSSASLAAGGAQQPRSLLFSASIILLVLLLMPCMNTTTAATQFLSPLHATLFLALHRPAFTLFVAIVLLQYQNDNWQQKNVASWPRLCSMFKRLSESSYAFMVFHPIILGGVFTFLDSLYSRKCPVSLAAVAAFGCCLATFAVADLATRFVHQPIFQYCRILLLQLLPQPSSKSRNATVEVTTTRHERKFCDE